MSTLAIVEVFAGLPDPRRTAGQRHTQALFSSVTPCWWRGIEVAPEIG